MIKITNEVDGKLYELMPAVDRCMECDFDTERKDYLGDCKLGREHAYYHGKIVCGRMEGIWKEVRDAD